MLLLHLVCGGGARLLQSRKIIMEFDITKLSDDIIPTNNMLFEVHQDAIGSEKFKTIEEVKTYIVQTIKSCFTVTCGGSTENDDSTEYSIILDLTITPVEKSKIPKNEEFFDLSPFKTLFIDYPELQVLPILSWGRYYKYELAGDPFGNDCTEYGFLRFEHQLRGYKGNEKIDWNLLKEIDKEWVKGKYQDSREGIELPYSEDCVKKYGQDRRGGTLLMLTRNGDTFNVECDSPE
jgi:hypothetical protein